MRHRLDIASHSHKYFKKHLNALRICKFGVELSWYRCTHCRSRSFVHIVISKCTYIPPVPAYVYVHAYINACICALACPQTIVMFLEFFVRLRNAEYAVRLYGSIAATAWRLQLMVSKRTVDKCKQLATRFRHSAKTEK